MKPIIFLISIILCTVGLQANAQNIFPAKGSTGIGTNLPDASSILEVSSTKKGMLLPRMTQNQRDAIALPATGLMIFQTNNSPGFYYFDGTEWIAVSVKSANTSLSNLKATTAVNSDLVPGINDSASLGSFSLKWQHVYASRLDVVSGIQNVFAGINAGAASTGNYNAGFGCNSLFSNTTGESNSAFGTGALQSNTTGYRNTAIGGGALVLNTTGVTNTAVGAYSLYYNGTGFSNVALGTKAGFMNVSGDHNTAIGDSALYSNITGNIVAVGYKSLFANTTGSYNVSVGTNSLVANTTGSGNTSVGASTLFSNITGVDNTAIGDVAMFSNTSGYQNTSIGEGSLYYNTTGEKNTATGVNALYSNTTGGDNTAIGNYSLNTNTTGYSNTAVGLFALNINISGSNNTAIGNLAGVSGDNFSNTTALGNNASPTASNMVRIGNSSVTSIGGYVNWTNISDGRVKKNIKQNVPGLAFINKLQPVTYNLDLTAADKIIQKPVTKDKDGKIIQPSPDELTARTEKEKVLYTGFVAQEVEKAAKELNYDFSGVDPAKNNKDLYGLRYSDFVVPLVKAVQELSKQNDALKNQNEEQQKTNANLQKQIDDLKAMISLAAKPGSVLTTNEKQQTINLTSASLEQNAPNPFSSGTTIRYILPQKYLSAQILITDKNGKILKQANISGTGKGMLNIDAATLSEGAYNYSLIIDGKLIGSKQMVVAR